MNNITTRELILIILLLLAIGGGVFGGIHYNRENRKYRRDIKQLEAKDARNAITIDSLKANVAANDLKDSILVSQIKDLYITTTDATPDSIHAMQPDSFISFITDFINRAGEANH